MTTGNFFFVVFVIRGKTLTTQHTKQHTLSLLYKAEGKSTGLQAALSHTGSIVSIRVVYDYISLFVFKTSLIFYIAL